MLFHPVEDFIDNEKLLRAAIIVVIFIIMGLLTGLFDWIAGQFMNFNSSYLLPPIY